jgi:hypothetical protein
MLIEPVQGLGQQGVLVCGKLAFVAQPIGRGEDALAKQRIGIPRVRRESDKHGMARERPVVAPAVNHAPRQYSRADSRDTMCKQGCPATATGVCGGDSTTPIPRTTQTEPTREPLGRGFCALGLDQRQVVAFPTKPPPARLWTQLHEPTVQNL